jgi:hypothetical protein
MAPEQSSRPSSLPSGGEDLPVFKPTPRPKKTLKQPIFFECRAGEVFFVDMAGLDNQTSKMLANIDPNVKGGDLKEFLKVLQKHEVGNVYYTVVPEYLLTEVMALKPKPGEHGDNTNQVMAADRPFQKTLDKFDKQNFYAKFFVRDDGIGAYHLARLVAYQRGFEVSWELLGTDEPITCGMSDPISVK